MNELKQENVKKALELCNTPRSDACKMCPYHEFGASCHTKRNADALALFCLYENYVGRLLVKDGNVRCLICDKEVQYIQKFLYDHACAERDNARAEAITEFAERLKQASYADCTITGYRHFIVDIKDIDQIAKEMKEGSDGSDGVH